MKNTIKNATTAPALVENVALDGNTADVTLSYDGVLLMGKYNPADKETATLTIKPIAKEISSKVASAVYDKYHGKPLSLVTSIQKFNVTLANTDVENVDALETELVIPSFPLLAKEKQATVKELAGLISLNISTLATIPDANPANKNKLISLCNSSIKGYLTEMVKLYMTSEETPLAPFKLRGHEVTAFTFTALKTDRKSNKMNTNGTKSIINYVEYLLFNRFNGKNITVTINGVSKDINGVTVSNGKLSTPATALSTLDKFKASLATTTPRKKTAK